MAELRADPVRSLAFGGIAATYNPIGSFFNHAVRIIVVQNLTDALLMFSFDGDNDHFPLPSNGLLVIDASTNRVQKDTVFFFGIRTRMHVRHLGVAPTSGDVYITIMYGRGE